MKYKLAGKKEGINCALCDFASVSNLKMIRHMKTSHTEPCLEKYDEDLLSNAPSKEKVLVEDMSVCIVSDNEEDNNPGTEELLVEEKSCQECNFLASSE